MTSAATASTDTSRSGKTRAEFLAFCRYIRSLYPPEVRLHFIHFTLDGTDHSDHATQARLIRRYIAWRNRNVDDTNLREVVNTATLHDAPLDHSSVQ
jgi:hypothetical protein